MEDRRGRSKRGKVPLRWNPWNSYNFTHDDRSCPAKVSSRVRVPYTKLACTLIALRLEPSFELASHEFIIFFRVSLRFLIVWYSKGIMSCTYFYCSCISKTFVFN